MLSVCMQGPALPALTPHLPQCHNDLAGPLPWPKIETGEQGIRITPMVDHPYSLLITVALPMRGDASYHRSGRRRPQHFNAWLRSIALPFRVGGVCSGAQDSKLWNKHLEWFNRVLV